MSDLAKKGMVAAMAAGALMLTGCFHEKELSGPKGGYYGDMPGHHTQGFHCGPDRAKHSCKGKNSCKGGKGGNSCKGKNSCSS